MIRRFTSRKESRGEEDAAAPRGFDDFDLRLGDMMRGERATMGKSLLDVQRELKIKASYIAAIENSDPSAFDTPGFIAGYVRSYARYLNLDPDSAFEAFCAESGFATSHGMSAQASGLKTPVVKDTASGTTVARDPFSNPATPFVPVGEGMFSRIEPGAVGSSLVLLALIGAIGFGAWTVLKEIQRVQLSPVEQTPVVQSELDPLAQAGNARVMQAGGEGFSPDSDALERLYRPRALDVPVMEARDGPIAALSARNAPSTLSPVAVASGGRLPSVGRQSEAVASAAVMVPDADEIEVETAPAVVPQVVEQVVPGVSLVAVRTAWVRVRAANGSVIFQGTMKPGDTYSVPLTEDPPTLRVGESGAVYFHINGQTYGPAGPNGALTKNLALSVEHLTDTYALAKPEKDGDLARMVAELSTLGQEEETP